MCGNGIRCLARFVADVDGGAAGQYRVDTLAGLIQPALLPDGQVRREVLLGWGVRWQVAGQGDAAGCCPSKRSALPPPTAHAQPLYTPPTSTPTPPHTRP